MSFTKPIAFVKAKAAPDIQQQEKNIPKNPFNVPVWAAIPQDEYYLEGIKNGVVVHSTDIIRKSVFTIGRLPSNDISLQHPSISRYHAVVVFKEDGMQYLYDLGSSHGTFLNKQNINSKNFVALHTGDMIRFGASSRLYILHGPERTEARNNRDETQGISWGLKRDAYAGDEWTGKDLQIGAVDRSTIPSDAPYLSDPKQALTVWLRKENEKMNIKFSEDDDGDKISYIARIELPIETGQGPLLAIGFGSKKGKAERDACLEACSKLDKLGVLSENQAEKQLIQKRLNEIKEEAELNDEYLDRTVKKRKVLGDVKSVETFDTLTSKKNDISASIAEIDKQLESLDGPQTNEEEDELDAFMANVESTLVTENRNKLVIKKKTLQEDLDQVCAMLKLATSSFTGFGNPVTNSSPPRDSQISSRSAGSDKKKQNNRSRDSQSSTASVPDTNHSSTQSPPSHSPNNAIHEDTKRKNESAKDASKSPPSRVFGAMNAPIMHLHDDTDHDAFIDATANTSTNESEIKRLSESYGY